MEEKYLINGTAVEVVEKLSNGYLVQAIYESYDEFGEPCLLKSKQPPYFVSDVYDEAPTEKIDARIEKLLEQERQLNLKCSDLTKKLNEQTSNMNAIKSLLESYSNPSIRLLQNYLEDKITHFVIVKYGYVDILEYKNIFNYKSDFNISINIDISNNDLKYRTWARLSGEMSTNGYDCYPCNSIEQAKEFALLELRKIWDDTNLDPNRRKAGVDCAIKIGIEVPQQVIESIKQKKESIAKDRVERLTNELKAAKKELENITSIN